MSENTPKAGLEYHTFVGFLVTQFAHMEANLRRILKSQAGMSEEAFQKLIGFPRTDEVLSKIRKTLRSDLPLIARQQVEGAFGQLGHLGKLRNWVVHYGGCAAEDGRFAIYLNPSERGAETNQAMIYLNQNEAWAACSDVNTVDGFLMGHLDFNLDPRSRQVCVEVAESRLPWRYVPPRLGQKRASQKL